jgi:hypothetical protein
MKFFHKGKDGGPESTVTGYWLVEIKSLFSIALLCFEEGSRDVYHSHAFNSISWVLKGRMVETHINSIDGNKVSRNLLEPRFMPYLTFRDTFHRVFAHRRTWVLTFRGPWSKQWKEYIPKEDKFITLENGRKTVGKK